MSRITHFFQKRDLHDEACANALLTFKPAASSPPVSIQPVVTTSNTEPSAPCPANLRQFYSKEIKVNATRYALENGIAATLRKYADIKRSTLRAWVERAQKAQAEALSAAPAAASAIPVDLADVLTDHRASNGYKLPELIYNAVHQWFSERREAGIAVSREMLRTQILRKAKEIDPDILSENGGWLSCTPQLMRTMEREMCVSRRRGTTAKRGSHGEKEHHRHLFIHRAAWICHEFKIPAQLVFHMDETSTHVLPVAKQTLEFTGAGVVPIAKSDDKRQITCTIAGNLKGDIFPAQLVFGPGAGGRLPSIDGLFCTFSHNHWADFDSVCAWLNDVIAPAAAQARADLGLPDSQQALLIWDVYSTHRGQQIRDYIGTHMPWLKLLYVPANCTDFLQIADVSLNKPFKVHLQKAAQEWLAEQLEAGKVDTRIRRMRPLIAQWVAQSVSYLRTIPAAINGIRSIGLHTIWRADVVAVALALHRAGHLWKSHSPRDLIAMQGEAALGSVTAAVDLPSVDVSDSDDELQAKAPRKVTSRALPNQSAHASDCKGACGEIRATKVLQSAFI